MGESEKDLKTTLEDLGIYLKPAQLKMNVKPLLRLVMQEFFGSMSGFVSACTQYLPSPIENAANKVFLY